MEYQEEDSYDIKYDRDIEIDGLRFELTCVACPEQYDVYDLSTQEQVAYVRLRWGHLYADIPDVGGTRVYDADIGDGWTGYFTNQRERLLHLGLIAKAIKETDPAETQA